MTWEIRLRFSNFEEMQKALREIGLDEFRGKFHCTKKGAGTLEQFKECESN